ncbi:hypothetical protein EB796_010216 [Bugula neritina]|uniref:Uncharacterized protein n=1 Tax=Bugula neritina TaxID=10212 RepID=A0A7J7K0H5_BUGNE|nr:hypothetical protein EB796_010216 [Bugula neritina]
MFYTQNSQNGVVFTNFIITLLYHSITADDSSIACMVINGQHTYTYICKALKSPEESVCLSAINLLSSLFACASRFEMPMTHSYDIPKETLAQVFDGQKLVTKAIHLQLW